MQDDRWIEIDEAEHAAEQAALDYLHENLPDAEPYRAWASFEFATRDKYRQVDCLIVGPRAIFIIEIKSWNGEITGNRMEWTQVNHGMPRSQANPRLLTNKKARELRGELEKTKAFRGSPRNVPRVVPLVFLAGRKFICRLSEEGRHGVAGFDPDLIPDGFAQGGGLPGVLELIRRFDTNTPVNAELSVIIREAMSELGVRPPKRSRAVGKAVLDEEVASGPQASHWSAHDESVETNRYTVTFQKPLGIASGGEERAERAAMREYELLSSNEMRHAGLPFAIDSDFEHPLGPAVAFALDPDTTALDVFLGKAGNKLGIRERVNLTRRVAEALDFAHSRRMFHRALRPEVIRVGKDSTGSWQPVITGWHTGLRAEAEEGGPGAVSGTTQISSGDLDSLRYQAPELFDASEPSLPIADIFSLGALSYFIFTGQQPPPELRDALEAGGGRLDTAATGARVPEDIQALIAYATEEDPGNRIPSVADFLELLDENVAIGQQSETQEPGAKPQASKEETADAKPLHPADIIPGLSVGAFEITQRLSEGSSGVAAVAVRSDGRRGVLKVSTSTDNDDRIEAEAKQLASVRSPAVIELIDGPLRVRGRSAIFMQEAEGGTLGERLRQRGAQDPEDAKRWGEDILRGLEDLERFGVLHRDIKPENVGLVEEGTAYRAVLLDLSLASTSADVLTVGTAPYRDPFLRRRPEQLYDHFADRYSAAMLLHELLTGRVPAWGDGTKDPYLCDLKLDEEALPTGTHDPLSAFFETALSKELDHRFDSARSMLRAWEDAFDTEAPEAVAKPAELILGISGNRVTATFATTRRDFEALLEQLKEIPYADREWDSAERRWLITPTEEAAQVLRRMCTTYEHEVSSEAAAALSNPVPRVEEHPPPGGPPRQVPGSEAAVSGLPPLVIDSLGGQIIKLMPRNHTASEEEIAAIKQRIREVPKSQRSYNEARRRWQLLPTPETAEMIMEIATETEVRFRPGAKLLINRLRGDQPDNHMRPPDETMPAVSNAEARTRRSEPELLLGAFALTDTGEKSTTKAVPPAAGEPTACEQHVYELTGPDGIALQVIDEKFENGERQIRTRDALNSGRRFEALIDRLRLSVIDHGGDLRVDLSQARIANPELDPDRGGMYRATEAQLSEAAGTDVVARLKEAGAVEIGTRLDLLDDTSPRGSRLCAIFPASAELVPVAAYVMIRVAPIAKRVPR